MEQKILEVSPRWVKSTIEAEYEKGWLVVAITLTEIDHYMIVFQRQKSEKEVKQPDHAAHQRAGYIARPENIH